MTRRIGAIVANSLLAAGGLAIAIKGGQPLTFVGPGAQSAPYERPIARGSRIAKPEGTCLELMDLRDIVIEDVTIGPCGGHGIELLNSRNVLIRNVRITGTQASGIFISDSQGIEIVESRIVDTVSGVYVVSSQAVKVDCNTFQTARGPVPRGQHVQFDKVTGAGNRISCNVGRNAAGKGEPEDAINLYQSRGNPGAPILVSDNLIVGGGPSESGGGIMLGDDGGAHQLAQRNVLVDPGQYGIAVASGTDMAVRGNQVYGRKQPFTNVGIYAWNQYPRSCSDVTISDNKVMWWSKAGRSNPFWDGGNCGLLAGIPSNNFKARLSAEALEAQPATFCRCSGQGRR